MKEKQVIDKIDQAIVEFYLNSNIEDIFAMAKEEGLNLDDTAEKRDKLAKRLKFLAQAGLKKEQDKLLLEKALSSLVEEYIGKPFAELKSLLQTKGLQVQYRNIDRLDEASIRDMLKHIDLVQLFENLENDETEEK